MATARPSLYRVRRPGVIGRIAAANRVVAPTFPVFEGVGSAWASSTQVTSHVIPMPATRPTGDKYYAIWWRGGAGSVNTVPSGWVLETTQALPSGTGTLAIYSHTGGAGEPASYTWTIFTAARGTGVIIRVSNATQTPDAFSTWASATDANDSVAASATTTVDNTLVIRTAGRNANATDDYITATPSTEIYRANAGPTAQAPASGASYENGPATAGATGTGTFSDAGGFAQWGAITMAIAPA